MEKEIGYYWIKIGDKWLISYWNGTKWINPYRSSINLEYLNTINTFKLIEEPKICLESINSKFGDEVKGYSCLMVDNVITRVRRLSDMQEFAIGDQIGSRGLNGMIISFEEINNQIRILFNYTMGQNYQYPIQTVLLKNARKI